MDEKMKDDIVKGLTGIFGNKISRIILYGSVARNSNTDESDIDIAFLLRGQMMDSVRDNFFEWCGDLDLKYNRCFSIIDINKENYEKWNKALPFYRNIEKEGIVLWKD